MISFAMVDRGMSATLLYILNHLADMTLRYEESYQPDDLEIL